MSDNILNSLDNVSRKWLGIVIQTLKDLKVEISNDNEMHYTDLIKPKNLEPNKIER